MKLIFIFCILISSINSAFSIEVIDKKNILIKLDEKIGDFDFERAFRNSDARYIELSCLKLLKSSWCRQKDIGLHTALAFDPESVPELKYAYTFFVDHKEKFKLLDDEYTKGNRNLMRVFATKFIAKTISSFKQKLASHLIYDENEGCRYDTIEFTGLSEFREFNKKMMKVSATIKVCSAIGVATFDMVFLFGPGNSMINRLREFTIGIDNIGYYRLIRTNFL